MTDSKTVLSVTPPAPHWGKIFVLSAPSGGGKSTLINKLLANHPNEFMFSVSDTTRDPRSNEKHGIHYDFISKNMFAAKQHLHAYLESAEIYGHSYGTPKGPVVAALQAGKDVLIDANYDGLKQLKAKLPSNELPYEVISVFITPPSLEILGARLRTRGTDKEEVIQRRLAKAQDEMNKQDQYDRIIVNDDIDRAAGELETFIMQKRRESDKPVNPVGPAQTLGRLTVNEQASNQSMQSGK